MLEYAFKYRQDNTLILQACSELNCALFYCFAHCLTFHMIMSLEALRFFQIFFLSSDILQLPRICLSNKHMNVELRIKIGSQQERGQNSTLFSFCRAAHMETVMKQFISQMGQAERRRKKGRGRFKEKRKARRTFSVQMVRRLPRSVVCYRGSFRNKSRWQNICFFSLGHKIPAN